MEISGKEESRLLRSQKNDFDIGYSEGLVSDETQPPEKQRKTTLNPRTWFLIELPAFLYFLSYRACLPLKEQLVYSLVSAELLPPTDDFLLDTHTTHGACTTDYHNISGGDAGDGRIIIWGNMTDGDAGPYSQGAVESEIQAAASQWLSYFNLIRNLPALFSAVLITAFTATAGRRVGLALPCLSGAVKAGLTCCFLYLNIPVGWLMVGEFVEGIGGSIVTAQACCNLYLSDLLSAEQLAFRFMLLQGLHYLATAAGNLGIGYLIEYIGFANSYWVLFWIYLVAMMWSLFILPETLKHVDRKPFQAMQILKDSVSVMKVYIRKRPDNIYTNYKLWLMLLVVMLDNFIILGRNDVDTLYMLGSPFCWTSVIIGYFQATKYLLKGSISVFGVGVLKACISDSMIGLIGTISGWGNSFLMAFAQSSLALWLVAPASMLSGMMAPLATAIMSKLLDADEQVSLFASLGVLAGLGDLLSGTFLNIIYAETVSIFPGLIFVLLGIIYFIGSICFIAVAIMGDGNTEGELTKIVPETSQPM